MKHIRLGDLDVARIGLGAMTMTGVYGTDGLDENPSIRTLQRALDLGVTDGAVLFRVLAAPAVDGGGYLIRGGGEVVRQGRGSFSRSMSGQPAPPIAAIGVDERGLSEVERGQDGMSVSGIPLAPSWHAWTKDAPPRV